MHVQLLFAAALVTLAAPAKAQSADLPAPPFTSNESAIIASDYRFRGVSQSDGDTVGQCGIAVGHEGSLYDEVRGSNLAGEGMFGGHLRPGFSSGKDGTDNIAGGTALASLTAGF